MRPALSKRKERSASVPHRKLRLTGGEKERQKLWSPRTLKVRPTSGKIREALFNILGKSVSHQKWLDLYAGAGSVGLEALSRGAEEVWFVEQDPAVASGLRESLRRLGWEKRGRIITSSVMKFLTRFRLPAGSEPSRQYLPRRGLLPPPSFDVVFLDPPYRERELSAVLGRLSRTSLLGSQSLVIVQHHKKSPLPPMVEGLRVVRERRYGETVLTFCGPVRGQTDGV